MEHARVGHVVFRMNFVAANAKFRLRGYNWAWKRPKRKTFKDAVITPTNKRA